MDDSVGDRPLASTAKENDRALLLTSDGKRFIVTLRAGARLQTHHGYLEHDDLIGKPYGSTVSSHLNRPFHLLSPSIYDELMGLKRISQIIYPKEIGQILLKLNLGPTSRVIEAGTGSGALTMALAHRVQPKGRVYSYEIRPRMLRVAEANLRRVGLDDYVEFIERDIADGFTVTDVDALFLDVREPWRYLAQVCAALRDNGAFGALVPTTNQVSRLLSELNLYPFTDIDVSETLERHYKPVPERLRPEDVMVGHTGYLLFARKINSGAFENNPRSQEAPQRS